MIVTIDLETHYSRDYSLTKMSEMEYILDPRFEIIGGSVKVGNAPAEWHVGLSALQHRLDQIDWSKAAMLGHNMRFDGSILYWHLGIKPALYLDTLCMARAMTHAVVGKSSLAAVAKYLGLQDKGGAVHQMIGKRLRDFSSYELNLYGDYCRLDTDLCRQIFDRLAPKIPKEELSVIDLCLRMYIEPQLMLTQDVLEKHLAMVRDEKQRIFTTVAHIDKTAFSSNQQFAVLLQQHGVEVPMKPSTADPTKQIPALARGDRAFQELLADESQPIMVQTLLAARVQSKSTIEETRTEKMLRFSQVQWPQDDKGWLPVPLRYYGAHTGRFSGDGGFNMQNIRRDSMIRKAIAAPPGYMIVARDASQIEARMVACMAGQQDLIEAFANGEDVYSKFASTVFGRKITKADKVERFIGKTCILGLGYGMGAERFKHALFIGSGGVSTDVELEEAKRIVSVYRRVYQCIPHLWTQLSMAGEIIQHLSRTAHSQLIGPWISDVESKLPCGIKLGFDAIWLPNGMPIAYPNMRYETDKTTGERRLCYDGPYSQTKYLFGGKLAENISQALARIVITDIMRRVWKERRLHPCLQVHDSLVYVVPESDAQEFDTYLEQQFAIRPSWAQGLPLASEGGYGRTLADAEGK